MDGYTCDTHMHMLGLLCLSSKYVIFLFSHFSLLILFCFSSFCSVSLDKCIRHIHSRKTTLVKEVFLVF
jgi:hypothetical protein